MGEEGEVRRPWLDVWLRCVVGVPVGGILCNPRVTAHAVGRLRFFFFPPTSTHRSTLWRPPLGAHRGGGGGATQSAAHMYLRHVLIG